MKKAKILSALLAATMLTACAQKAVRPMPDYDVLDDNKKPAAITTCDTLHATKGLERTNCYLGVRYNELLNHRDKIWYVSEIFDIPIISLALSTAGLAILGGDGDKFLGLRQQDLAFAAGATGVWRQYFQPENMQKAFTKSLEGHSCLVTNTDTLITLQKNYFDDGGSTAVVDTQKLNEISQRLNLLKDEIKYGEENASDYADLLDKAAETLNRAKEAQEQFRKQLAAMANANAKLKYAAIQVAENARTIAERGEVEYLSVYQSIINSQKAFTDFEKERKNIQQDTPGGLTADDVGDVETAIDKSSEQVEILKSFDDPTKNIRQTKDSDKENIKDLGFADENSLRAAVTANPDLIKDKITAMNKSRLLKEINYLEAAISTFMTDLPDVTTQVSLLMQCAQLVKTPLKPEG